MAHLVGTGSSQVTTPPVPTEAPPSASLRPGSGASTSTATGERHQLLWCITHIPEFESSETQTRGPVFPLGSSLFLWDPFFSLDCQLILASPHSM